MCCKKILNILNVLNRDVRAIKCPLDGLDPNTPFAINFSGERLIVSWTRKYTTFVPGQPPKVIVRPHQDVYTDTESISIDIKQGLTFGKIVDDCIYLKCINVTYLEVNGEILINL